MYKLLKQEGKARRAEFQTNRGTVQTPAFMNVATCAAISAFNSAESSFPEIIISFIFICKYRPNQIGKPIIYTTFV